MTVHTVYEVRAYREDDWQIEAVLDDQSLAVAAARKIESRFANTPVVVVQEIRDVARNHLKSRSVYRSEPAGQAADGDGGAKAPPSDARRSAKREAVKTGARAVRPAAEAQDTVCSAAGTQLPWVLFGLLLLTIATYVAVKSFSA
ncbi:MAG: hypothetical protein D6763_11455 [Alphaproteobacteria bacterium]|nr:MAG: hypothetical protein D6763_11455 [Alphaproteobacteria bacterium]